MAREPETAGQEGYLKEMPAYIRTLFCRAVKRLCIRVFQLLRGVEKAPENNFRKEIDERLYCDIILQRINFMHK